MTNQQTSPAKKHPCMCVRYFSEKQAKIITDFLGLIELEKADAQTLNKLVRQFFKDNKLNLL